MRELLPLRNAVLIFLVSILKPHLSRELRPILLDVFALPLFLGEPIIILSGRILQHDLICEYVLPLKVPHEFPLLFLVAHLVLNLAHLDLFEIPLVLLCEIVYGTEET